MRPIIKDALATTCTALAVLAFAATHEGRAGPVRSSGSRAPSWPLSGPAARPAHRRGLDHGGGLLRRPAGGSRGGARHGADDGHRDARGREAAVRVLRPWGRASLARGPQSAARLGCRVVGRGRRRGPRRAGPALGVRRCRVVERSAAHVARAATLPFLVGEGWKRMRRSPRGRSALAPLGGSLRRALT